MCYAPTSSYVLCALNARLGNERGGDFVRCQSTLSETLARVAAPNFAFIIFAFFPYVVSIRVGVGAANKITRKRTAFTEKAFLYRFSAIVPAQTSLKCVMRANHLVLGSELPLIFRICYASERKPNKDEQSRTLASRVSKYAYLETCRYSVITSFSR